MDVEEILIVTGLPRSGTSLMMRTLCAAGIPVLTDGGRQPDKNNPLGYLEWEPVLTLPENPSVIRAARGKAVKVLTPLIPYLPPDFSYRALFMRRPFGEIARSQHAMRFGNAPEALPPEKMEEMLRNHTAATLAFLSRAEIPVLEVDYPALVCDPGLQSHSISSFLGLENILVRESLASAIAPELRRIR